LNTFADGSSLRDDLFTELPIMVDVVEHLNLATRQRTAAKAAPCRLEPTVFLSDVDYRHDPVIAVDDDELVIDDEVHVFTPFRAVVPN
jgi:hypothetical protein